MHISYNLLHPTSEHVKIRKNTVLGICEPIDEIVPSVKIDQNVCRSIDVATHTGQVKPLLIPEHFTGSSKEE